MNRPLLRVGPVAADVDEIQHELDRLVGESWRREPTRDGMTFVPLVQPRGDHTVAGLDGVFAATTWLDDLPCTAKLLESFHVPVGRTRLVRIDTSGDLIRPATHRYWFDRTVIVIPIRVPGHCSLRCGADYAAMEAGSAWIVDPLRDVVLTIAERVDAGAGWIHLEVATASDPAVVAESVARPTSAEANGSSLRFERNRHPRTVPPGLVDSRVARLVAALPDGEGSDQFARVLTSFAEQWRQAWLVGGPEFSASGHQDLQQWLADELDTSTQADGGFVLPPAVLAQAMLADVDIGPAVDPVGGGEPPEERFDRPIFIVGSPASGARRLQSALAKVDGVYTVDPGLHSFIARASGSGSSAGSVGDVIGADAATDTTVAALKAVASDELVDRHGMAPAMNATKLRFIEAGIQNPFRVEFLDRVFPDALYIFITRDPTDELAHALTSDQAGAEHDRAVGISPDDVEERDQASADSHWDDGDLEDVVTWWQAANSAALETLDTVAPGRWTIVHHEELVAAPRRTLRRLARFVDIDPNPTPERIAVLDRHRLRRLASCPVPPDVLASATAHCQPLASRLRRLAMIGAASPKATSRAQSGGAAFSDLLGRTGLSLLVTTRDPDALVVIGSDGRRLDIDRVAIPMPFGVSCGRRGEIVVATESDLWSFRNQPSMAAKLASRNGLGACFVLRHRHHTGALCASEVVHDADGQVWLSSATYSCLATIDPEFSFVPRWMPDFVTELAPDDRCHLSGVAVRDGRPRYVTAYSPTDSGYAWKDTASFGGVVIDVTTDEVIAEGLSTPVAPRWHQDHLWVVDTDGGRLVEVDVETGDHETVAELGGRATGLAFIGRFAVVGVSSNSEVGLAIVDTADGSMVGGGPLDLGVGQICDVQVRTVPGRILVAGPSTALHRSAVVVPPFERAPLRSD